MTSGPYTSDTAPLAHSDVLVLDYLAALWAATDELDPDLRDELMTTVADYIAMRRAAGSDPQADPAPVLLRLGPPEQLAAAARRGRVPVHLRRPAAPVVMPAPVQSSGTEYAAVALLAAGTVVLPVIAPLAGLMLVSGSPRWSAGHKTAAWLLAGAPVALGFAMVLAAMAFGTGGEVLVLAYLLMIAGAFVAGMSLLPGLSARRTYPPGH
jgi:uncharacterized membrane protein